MRSAKHRVLVHTRRQRRARLRPLSPAVWHLSRDLPRREVDVLPRRRFRQPAANLPVIFSADRFHYTRVHLHNVDVFRGEISALHTMRINLGGIS